MTHPAMVISKGKVRTAAEVTGGIWSFFSLTARIMSVITCSTASCSFACRFSRTAQQQKYAFKIYNYFSFRRVLATKTQTETV